MIKGNPYYIPPWLELLMVLAAGIALGAGAATMIHSQLSDPPRNIITPRCGMYS